MTTSLGQLEHVDLVPDIPYLADQLITSFDLDASLQMAALHLAEEDVAVAHHGEAVFAASRWCARIGQVPRSGRHLGKTPV